MGEYLSSHFNTKFGEVHHALSQNSRIITLVEEIALSGTIVKHFVLTTHTVRVFVWIFQSLVPYLAILVTCIFFLLLSPEHKLSSSFKFSLTWLHRSSSALCTVICKLRSWNFKGSHLAAAASVIGRECLSIINSTNGVIKIIISRACVSISIRDSIIIDTLSTDSCRPD